MSKKRKDKVIAFIPARGGSKSIPLKNIKEFAGKPLIHWVISAATKCNDIDKVVVSTDHEKIIDIAMETGSGKLKVARRSSETATDTASTESAMLEYLRQEQSTSDNDIMILMQATSPWTMSKHLSEAVSKYRKGNYDSMLSVVHSHAFQWNAQGTPLNYDYRNRPMRQSKDAVFQENGAFYINRVGNIIHDGNRLSGSIGLYPMHKYSSLELDEPEDWVLAESMMRIYLKEVNS